MPLLADCSFLGCWRSRAIRKGLPAVVKEGWLSRRLALSREIGLSVALMLPECATRSENASQVKANQPVRNQMSNRTGSVSIEYNGRQLEGTFVVFGRRVTVESGSHTKAAYDPGSVAGARGLARIMLRELAEEGLI
jgi:hypothetical protein